MEGHHRNSVVARFANHWSLHKQPQSAVTSFPEYRLCFEVIWLSFKITLHTHVQLPFQGRSATFKAAIVPSLSKQDLPAALLRKAHGERVLILIEQISSLRLIPQRREEDNYRLWLALGAWTSSWIWQPLHVHQSIDWSLPVCHWQASLHLQYCKYWEQSRKPAKRILSMRIFPLRKVPRLQLY